MESNKKLSSYSDGGARGNPGPAGLGAVLLDGDGNTLAEISKYLGVTTNNQAEYRALIEAITKANELGASHLDCFLDSELIVKQLKGEYKVKNADLKPHYETIKSLCSSFAKVSFTHIPRERNKEADRLANLAMDRAS